jgi:hypothetical protein
MENINMGFWSTNLYGNDLTLDVKDSFTEYLKNNEYHKAIKKLKEEYLKDLDEDEESLFWYALAEREKFYGITDDDAIDIALKYIKNNGGIKIFDTKQQKEKWKITLEKLKEKLLSDNRPLKLPKKPKEFKTNPWEVGDYIAYQFNTEKAKEYNLYGKYIVLKKIADYEGFEHKFYSYVQIYNHIYDELPNINEIRETDLLPLLILTDEEKKEIETEEKRCFAYFEYFCIRDFKKKYYTVIGNKKTEDLKVEKSLDWFDFSDFEDDIIEYYNCWKHD